MRILHCLRAPVGGLFRHVLDLAEEQASRGHDVGILADSTAEDRLTPLRFAALAPKLTLGIARADQPYARHRRPRSSQLRSPSRGKARPRCSAWAWCQGRAYARLAAWSLSSGKRQIKSFYTPHGGSLNFKPGTLESRGLLMIERPHHGRPVACRKSPLRCS